MVPDVRHLETQMPSSPGPWPPGGMMQRTRVIPGLWVGDSTHWLSHSVALWEPKVGHAGFRGWRLQLSLASGESHLGKVSLLDFILPSIKLVLLNYRMFLACRKVQNKNPPVSFVHSSNSVTFLLFLAHSGDIVDPKLPSPGESSPTPHKFTLLYLFERIHLYLSITASICLLSGFT